MKFKVGDVVKDEDNDDIRIVCVDKEGDYPIIGVFGSAAYEYKKDGSGSGVSNLVAPAKSKVKYLAYEDSLGFLVHCREGCYRGGSTPRPALDLEREVDE